MGRNFKNDTRIFILKKMEKLKKIWQKYQNKAMDKKFTYSQESVLLKDFSSGRVLFVDKT